MRVIVDGATIDSPKPEEDVFEFITGLSKRLQGEGRAITSIELNGRDIDPEHLRGTCEGTMTGEVTRLDIRSELVSRLVAQCLDELDRAMPDLVLACRELATVFQGTEPQAGFEPFEQLAEAWGNIKSRQAMVARALGISLESDKIDGQSLSGLHQELNTYLEEAANALEKNDLILLGDLLEYELAPRAEVEAKITRLLRERAAAVVG
jgi:hypothetical protein